MKAFVHKNKDGKYYTGKVDKDGKRIFSKNLVYADKYYENEFALKFCPKGCKTVEITIAEGDLEQELAEKEEEIKRLKYQILYSQLQAPKEEIEKFNMVMSYQSLDYRTLIRKQVCDEIRNAIDNEEYELRGDNNRILSIHAKEFNEILDKIEKGSDNE